MMTDDDSVIFRLKISPMKSSTYRKCSSPDSSDWNRQHLKDSRPEKVHSYTGSHQKAGPVSYRPWRNRILPALTKMLPADAQPSSPFGTSAEMHLQDLPALSERSLDSLDISKKSFFNLR